MWGRDLKIASSGGNDVKSSRTLHLKLPDRLDLCPVRPVKVARALDILNNTTIFAP